MSQLKNPSFDKEGRLLFRQPSRTKKDLAPETDINVIVGRFLKTGQLPSAVAPGQYGDLTSTPSLQDALAKVNAATKLFNALPSQLRAELGHDPVQLEGWLRDPANSERALKLGLINPPAPAPSPAPSSTPSTPPPTQP